MHCSNYEGMLVLYRGLMQSFYNAAELITQLKDRHTTGYLPNKSNGFKYTLCLYDYVKTCRTTASLLKLREGSKEPTSGSTMKIMIGSV